MHVSFFSSHTVRCCSFSFFFLFPVIYRWQQAMPPTMAVPKKIVGLMNFAYTILVLNYSCVGFMVSQSSLNSLYFLHTMKRRLIYDLKFLMLLCEFFSVIFQVLSLHETIASYGSVYYIGTIIPIVFILLGYVIKPAKPAKSKARKDEWVCFSISSTSQLGVRAEHRRCLQFSAPFYVERFVATILIFSKIVKTYWIQKFNHKLWHLHFYKSVSLW